MSTVPAGANGLTAVIEVSEFTWIVRAGVDPNSTE
jgi:hypothetical protein